MLALVDHELQVDVIPSGKGARGFADILLRIIADPHGEQLHDFTGEIFVRGALDVHAGVEEGKHGRVLSDGDGEIPEIARSVFLEKLELAEQLAIVAYLRLVGSEVAVPEQRHLLL